MKKERKREREGERGGLFRGKKQFNIVGGLFGCKKEVVLMIDTSERSRLFLAYKCCTNDKDQCLTKPGFFTFEGKSYKSTLLPLSFYFMPIYLLLGYHH